MKGIILAGGSGTRLYPSTFAISKHLLPVFDKPMIYYPLSILMLSGIREVLLISTPRDIPLFKRLLGDGSAFGIRLSYAEQPEPRGLPEAFLIGQDFLAGEPCVMILGDNIFHGHGLVEKCLSAVTMAESGRVTAFAYQVDEPERYGVVSFDTVSIRPLLMEEKPEAAQSKWALTGLYFCDRDVVELSSGLTPSARGELEITELLGLYLAQQRLDIVQLGPAYAWLDMGTHESLHDASSFVRAIERRQGIKIACLEEIALNLGYIQPAALKQYVRKLGDTQYATYLANIVAQAEHGDLS